MERVPLDEQETIINYGATDDWAEVYTSDKNVIKRYEKFSREHPDYCKTKDKDMYGAYFDVHPKCASLYPRAPRKMTDEQKAILRERLLYSRIALRTGSAVKSE